MPLLMKAASSQQSQLGLLALLTLSLAGQPTTTPQSLQASMS